MLQCPLVCMPSHLSLCPICNVIFPGFFALSYYVTVDCYCSVSGHSAWSESRRGALSQGNGTKFGGAVISSRHICNQVAYRTWLARTVWQTQRGTSVTFLQSSRWSLCYLSQSSISAYEINTPHWSDNFHPLLCMNWCLQIVVLSTYTSRLQHSVCWSPSQVLIVCKPVSWSGRLSHDTPVVKD